MGNPYNGEIYRLTEGQEPEPGHVPLTEAEAFMLERMPTSDRIGELQKMMRRSSAESSEVVEPPRELPRYRSHKEVCALKIKSIGDPNEATDGSRLLTFEEEGYAPVCVNHDFMLRHRPEVGGYYVVYRDGYRSFSPAEAFEEGYTRMEQSGE
jgi:hypothetical protein